MAEGIASDAVGDYAALYGIVTQVSRSSTTSSFDVNLAAAGGAANGTPITVATISGLAAPDEAAIAMNAAGDFVVTWETSTGANSVIMAQIYNSAGTPVGSAMQVSTASGAIEPKIAMDATGDFMVGWFQPDGNSYDVDVRSYNSSGTALSAAVTVATDTSSKPGSETTPLALFGG